MGKLTGKVAVVTGASKGIGAAVAETFGAEGAKVVVNYSRDKAGAQRVVEKVKKSGGEAIAVQADVSKAKDVKKLFAETASSFGKVDVLVNNAGVYEFRSIDEFDEEHYHKHFDLNVLGLLLTTKEAVANMNGSGGSIINISSIASKTPPANSYVYSGTKGAVDVISRALAVELGARKIRVNALAPGATETEGVQSMPGGVDGLKQAAVSRTPLGRMGTVDDIAKATLFLASDDSGWITGEELLVGGGIRL
ncbi:MAG TPA: glucose 1-dehydrogenase [Candidatus Angelobacter sp.]|nr:glucose 1-dehydrogenase [Candidatus Angelobacter sp.]